MALVFGANEKMDRAYKDAILEVSDKANIALIDFPDSPVQDVIGEEIDEFMSWYENAAVVYGYLLGTNQCTTAGEA